GDHLQVLDGHAHAAHAARQALAFDDARRERRRADRSRLVVRRAAVGRAAARELVALARALETAADRRRDDIDVLADLELVDLDLLAGLVLGAVLDPELAQQRLRLGPGLLELADHRLRQVLLALLAEAELNGGVAVLLFGLHLDDRARAGFDQRC